MKIGTTPFIAENIAPPNAAALAVFKGEEKVCEIDISKMKLQGLGEKRYSFGLVSDCHTYHLLTSWDGNTKLDNALTYMESIGCIMCIGCGDMTQTGCYSEDSNGSIYYEPAQMEAYHAIIQKHSIPVFEIFGNHENYYGKDVTLTPTAFSYTGIPATAYSVTSDPDTDTNSGTNKRPNKQMVQVGDDVFLFLGQPSAGVVMSNDDYHWLALMLELNKKKRCFVFIHSYMEGDSGDADNRRENSIFEMWGKDRTEGFTELMSRHGNTILFHGHSHMKFEYQATDKKANFSTAKGYKSVHIPSLGVPRDIDDGATADKDTPEDTAASQGYIVDVYNNCIILNGMDFVRKTPVQIATYKINI